MVDISKLFRLTKLNSIQVAAVSLAFFTLFSSTYVKSNAAGSEMKQWDNTKIIPNQVEQMGIGDSTLCISEAEAGGIYRELEVKRGSNMEVISPEAQLLMDIDYILGGPIAISCVESYVNVRVSPDVSAEATAKIYNNAVVFIQGEEGDWYKIKSGNAEGYVMKQYFIADNELAEAIIGEEPYSRRELLEDKSYQVGITLEEEEAIRIAKEEAERKARERIAAEQAAARRAAMAQGNAYSLEDTTELRKAIVEYACQFVGLKYVLGGNSLVTGTDCSGFTQLIYAHFGYKIGRTPEAQYNNDGRLVTYAEAQPGDIIVYCNKAGKKTHVAIYIGDGKIIHAANSRQNTYIGNATYNTIAGVKNIID